MTTRSQTCCLCVQALHWVIPATVTDDEERDERKGHIPTSIPVLDAAPSISDAPLRSVVWLPCCKKRVHTTCVAIAFMDRLGQLHQRQMCCPLCEDDMWRQNNYGHGGYTTSEVKRVFPLEWRYDSWQFDWSTLVKAARGNMLAHTYVPSDRIRLPPSPTALADLLDLVRRLPCQAANICRLLILPPMFQSAFDRPFPRTRLTDEEDVVAVAVIEAALRSAPTHAWLCDRYALDYACYAASHGSLARFKCVVAALPPIVLGWLQNLGTPQCLHGHSLHDARCIVQDNGRHGLMGFLFCDDGVAWRAEVDVPLLHHLMEFVTPEAVRGLFFDSRWLSRTAIAHAWALGIAAGANLNAVVEVTWRETLVCMTPFVYVLYMLCHSDYPLLAHMLEAGADLTVSCCSRALPELLGLEDRPSNMLLTFLTDRQPYFPLELLVVLEPFITLPPIRAATHYTTSDLALTPKYRKAIHTHYTQQAWQRRAAAVTAYIQSWSW